MYFDKIIHERVLLKERGPLIEGVVKCRDHFMALYLRDSSSD